MSAFLCQCKRPKPRPDGKGGKVCVECHGKVWEQKSQAAPAKGDTIPDEQTARRAKLEAIERQLHYLIGQVRELKNI